MSLADRLSTTEELLDHGVDALETPHDPIAFDEARWASGTRTRRNWIGDEYERSFGSRRPADFDARFNDDMQQTYGTTKPWEDARTQDFPGQTRSEWMKFKPKDRYGDSARSALIPDEVPVTDDFTAQIDKMQAEFDAEARIRAGRDTGEPNIPDIDPEVFAGWDQGTQMVELGGGGQVTSEGLTVHTGVNIRQESDSYIGSNGDSLAGDGEGGSEAVLQTDNHAQQDLADSVFINRHRNPEYQKEIAAQDEIAAIRKQHNSEIEGTLVEMQEITTNDPRFSSSFDDPDISEDESDYFTDEDEKEAEAEQTPGDETETEASLSESDADAETVEASRVEGQVEAGEWVPPVMQRGPRVVTEPVAVDPPVPVVPDVPAPIVRVSGPKAPYQPGDWVPPLNVEPPDVDAAAGTDQMGAAPDSLPPDIRPWYQKIFRRNPKPSILEPPEMSEMVPLLGHKPSSRELSPPVTDEVRAGFNEVITEAAGRGLSAEAVANEMGIGVSSGGQWWIQRATAGDYLAKQGKGLLGTPMIAALTLWLNSEVDGLGDFASLGMITTDFLTTGDPLGLLIWGAAQVFDQAAQSRQKVIDNDDPNKEYGSRMGYVREGDTWYPAVYNSRFKSTGMFAEDNNMSMDYGNDVVYIMDGESKWVPVVVDSKPKDFVAQNAEWDNKTMVSNKDYLLSSKQFLSGDVKAGDTTRDWYFLSPEDASKVVNGTLKLEAYDDDVEAMNPARRQVNDWRKALDAGHDWKWSTAVHAMGSDATQDRINGSRGLQDVLYLSNNNSTGGYAPSQESDYATYIQNMTSGTGPDATFHPPTEVFHDYLYGTIMKKRLAALYRTQREAAQEAGFDKLYNNEFGKKYAAHGGDKWKDEKDLATAWSSMYLDTSKDMPAASSAEELAQQLHDIEVLNDRSPKQRNYLAQKVQTRYWMQQLVQTGGSNDLMHFLYGRDSFSANPSGTKVMTLSGLEDYDSKMADYGTLDFDDWLETQKIVGAHDESQATMNSHLDTMPGFTAPWQNAGEGMLPTLTGSLQGTDITDYMDDYRSTAYTRMGAEAADKSQNWIMLTGKLDPNLKIDGTDWNMGIGGILSGASEAYDEYLKSYVGPGQNSKWTQYDPESGDFKLTQEGKDRVTLDEAAAVVESEAEKKAREAEAEAKAEKKVKWLDEQGAVALQQTAGDLDPDAAAEVTVTDEAWGGGTQEVYRDPEMNYDLPSAGWFYTPARGGQLEFYTAPDGKVFTITDFAAADDMYKYDDELARQVRESNLRARLSAEADAEAADAKAAAEAAAADAEAAAEVEAARVAQQGRDDAWDADARAREQADLIAKWQREYDEARAAEDAQKHQSEVDAWRAQGEKLGLMDPTDPDVPDPYANSHGNDPVEHTHAISVPMPESILHEEQVFVPMTEHYIATLAAFEAGPAVQAPMTEHYRSTLAAFEAGPAQPPAVHVKTI